MADCGPIIGLKLDQVSQKAIQQINDNGKVGKLIVTVTTMGVFNSIFTKNKAPVAGYNHADRLGALCKGDEQST